MKRVMLLSLLCLALAGGCVTSGANQRADLLAARQMYSGTVNSLAVLRTQGAFKASEGEAVEQAARVSLQILDKWEAELFLAEREGRLLDQYAVANMFADQFRAYLREMIAAQIAAERYIINKEK
jgi:hypothetical protein